MSVQLSQTALERMARYAHARAGSELTRDGVGDHPVRMFSPDVLLVYRCADGKAAAWSAVWSDLGLYLAVRRGRKTGSKGSAELLDIGARSELLRLLGGHNRPKGFEVYVQGPDGWTSADGRVVTRLLFNVGRRGIYGRPERAKELALRGRLREVTA